MESVYFAGNEYENLSNFSAHQIEYQNIIFPTCEHLYHYLRYDDISIQKEILSAKSPYLAHKISQKYKSSQISTFSENKIIIMKDILLLKINQHNDVLEILLQSKNKIIEKILPVDLFWGLGKERTGNNKLGKLWMEIRDELNKK